MPENQSQKIARPSPPAQPARQLTSLYHRIQRVLSRWGWQLRRAVRGALRRLKKPWWIFAPRYYLEDFSQVTLYCDDPDLFPEYWLRRRLAAVKSQNARVSLVATVLNEAANAPAWLESVTAQTRLPAEIVIVDAGSEDGTLEHLRAFAPRSPVPLKVISRPGVNIAQGRNLAIRNARGPVIACTDFGCRPQPDWLEKLVIPFEDDPQTQVVAGWFRALAEGRPFRRLGWAALAEVDPQGFLPSSRSVAFRKDSWATVGGYPEWLSLTGEDTYFAAELKRTCRNWAFVPGAVVGWEAPATPAAYWQKIRAWSIGDGESGAFTQYAWWSFVRLAAVAIMTLGVAAVAALAWLLGLISPLSAWALVLLAGISAFLIVYQGMFRVISAADDLVWELGAELARLSGFLQGVRQREEATTRRFRAAPGVFLILSVIPIDDTGGGARSTQIAMELLRRGYLVMLVNQFPKYETVELDLHIQHPNLITRPIARFNWPSFSLNYSQHLAGKPLTALVELPSADFLPILTGVRELGGSVVYDLLDDWQTSLGSQWYSPEVEQRIVAQSQILVATAPPLVARLEQLSGRPVTLLPNAVNHRLFDPQRIYPRPADLPRGDWTAIYVGALWGEWFDWDLLVQIAREYPAAAVTVVGDYAGQCPQPPPNLHFLGLKPQPTLPAYLAYSEVALVPWKANPITQATSPLKVYEYLAMRKPVVAPDLQPLHGIPGVYLAADRSDFLAKIGIAHQEGLPEKEVARFILENHWPARVDRLLACLHQVHQEA